MKPTAPDSDPGACGCGCRGGGPAHECIAAADAMLDQAAAFIAGLDAASYARPCALASDGTIGKHVRHSLDHFAAALAAAEADEPIDYDLRERDVPMETLTSAALDAVSRIRRTLGGLTARHMDAPVTVRVMVDADGRTVELGSTLGRELAFATHHAVHHHAMMKFIAESFGLATPAGFGRAPSTVHHDRRVSATLSG